MLFISSVMMCHGTAHALTVKKAAPVATKESTAKESAASLVPTVMNLVSGIQQLNAKQNEMTAECIPTASEITFVNNTIKEWAKTGAMSAKEVEQSLRMKPCEAATGGYARSVEMSAGTDMDEIVCYDWFGGSGNEGMVWYRFPMAAKATYCADGMDTCSTKNQKTTSNIYNVFNLIDFSEADYTKDEARMAATLTAKIENCSDAKLSAKKRAMWGEFLTNTIGSMGQSTNTGAIMQQVGAVSNSGLSGGLQSLGGIASQFMDR